MRFKVNNSLAILSIFLTFFLFVHIQNRTFSSQKNIPYLGKIEKVVEIPAECACKSPVTGAVFDFCYRLPENPSTLGKKFDCQYVEEWEKIENQTFTNLQDPLPEPVFVTAFSDGFVRNGKRLIASLRTLGFQNKIVVYSLGVRQSDLDLLKDKACNVEIREFQFSKYPAYMKNLKSYRWKPIVIAETLRDFGAIWYLDSSVFFKKFNVSHVYDLVTCHKDVQDRPPLLPSSARDLRESREPHESGWDLAVWERNLKECRKGQYLLHGYSGHGIMSVTHPDVYKYFPTNPSEMHKEKAKMYDAGFVFAVNTRQTVLDVVKWYFLCALQEDCMAPKGASLSCSFKGTDRFINYANCHRYDQSIINLVLANQFWYDRRFYVSEIVDFFQIDRSSSMKNFDNDMGCL